ncbi:MAG: NADH-quinone oxidoreductase subunit C [Actinomycetales bacterium]|nr:NADH-quinone oxidoreductase subunit C [Actinomycetales bacterium]
MIADDMLEVAVAEWAEAAREARDGGLPFLELLTVVDRGDELDVVARMSDASGRLSLGLMTRVAADAPRIESLAAVLPAASWHEREVAEMFGVVFDGHPDPRPLLLRGTAGAPPLRRGTPLAVRLERAWPGEVEPASRRRSRQQLPPGVRPEWLPGGSA